MSINNPASGAPEAEDNLSLIASQMIDDAKTESQGVEIGAIFRVKARDADLVAALNPLELADLRRKVDKLADENSLTRKQTEGVLWYFTVCRPS